MKLLPVVLLVATLFIVCDVVVTADDSSVPVTKVDHCADGSLPCAPTDLDVDGLVEAWEILWYDLCGQYTIHYLNGTLTTDQLPDGCLSLPPADFVRMHA